LAAHRVVLVPASQDGGTNMLGLATAGVMNVAFGPDSFRNHHAAARRAGIEPSILHLEGAGHDIDVSSDLFCTEGGGSAPRTRAILRRLERHAPVQPPIFFKEMCSHE
jgi:2-phospho-L-lactate guanylyltransferase (CobY/MobA/RfbA family)